jgi:nuclear transport factor 2 (NTF2) superfamily protein
MAVRFAYEYHDDSGNWFGAYGNENWECDEFGLNRSRHASMNDSPIMEAERKFHWDRSGPRRAACSGQSWWRYSPCQRPRSTPSHRRKPARRIFLFSAHRAEP